MARSAFKDKTSKLPSICIDPVALPLVKVSDQKLLIRKAEASDNSTSKFIDLLP